MIAEEQDFAAVIARAKAMLAAEFGLLHATLEPETAAQGLCRPGRLSGAAV